MNELRSFIDRVGECERSEHAVAVCERSEHTATRLVLVVVWDALRAPTQQPRA